MASPPKEPPTPRKRKGVPTIPLLAAFGEYITHTFSAVIAEQGKYVVCLASGSIDLASPQTYDKEVLAYSEGDTMEHLAVWGHPI